jgi:molecular chaperone GrpE
MASILMYKEIVMASKKSTEKEKEQSQQPENMAENTVNQEQVESNEAEVDSANVDDAAAVEAIDAESIQSEKEKYLRLYSEFENFRRRTTKERLEWMQNASKDMIEAVLPVVDDMERALNALKNAGDSTASEGMELIFKKLYGNI